MDNSSVSLACAERAREARGLPHVEIADALSADESTSRRRRSVSFARAGH